MRPFCTVMLLLAGVWASSACHRRQAADSVVFLIDRDVEGLDPHTSGMMQQTQEVLAHLCEGLVSFDAQLSVVPALAVSWSNPDERTWVFQLRQGVTFHTGQALTSADVVWSLLRARDNPASAHRATLANLRSVSDDGPHAVRLTLGTPDALLLGWLREVYIVPAGTSDEVLRSRPPGTGPYDLAARKVGVSLDLVRYEGYWGTRPALARVRFLARSFGDDDLGTLVPPGSEMIFWQRPGCPLYERATRIARPIFNQGLSISYLGFDLSGDAATNPLVDRGVREAVALGLDLAAIREAATAGRSGIPTQMIPPSVFGFDPGVPPPVRDLPAARRRLAERVGSEPPATVLRVREMMSEYAGPVAHALTEIGFIVRVDVLPDDAFFRSLKGGGGFYVLRFSCRTGDAQELLDRWVHSRDKARGLGGANFSYDVDPVPGLDAEIDAARSEMNPWRRRQVLQRIMRRVTEERLTVPLLHPQNFTFATPGIDWQPRLDTYRLAFGSTRS